MTTMNTQNIPSFGELVGEEITFPDNSRNVVDAGVLFEDDRVTLRVYNPSDRKSVV